MRLTEKFYQRDCLEVAPDLVGKILVHQLADGSQLRLRISETEAYCGEADTACHAHKGRTKRTEVLYQEAGRIYVYLCYGMHWLLNFVTGEKDRPQAVLIRACQNADGPGKLTKRLQIDGSFNNTSVFTQDSLWVEDDGKYYTVIPDVRVGIGYASEEDQNRLWRFKMGERRRNIGLTGGVGAGKSEVLSWMEREWGAKVIRTDETARQIMEPGQEGYLRVTKALGTSFLDEQGRIDRPALARLIFRNEAARNTVNAITHPCVWNAVMQELNRNVLTEKETAEAKLHIPPVTVVESALFDEHAAAFFDELWYVYAPEEVRIKRLMEGRGYSRERCEQMINSQMSDQEFRRLSSRVIDNGKSWEETEKELRTLLG